MGIKRRWNLKTLDEGERAVMLYSQRRKREFPGRREWYLIRRRAFESGEEEGNGNWIERTVSMKCLKPDPVAFVSEEVVRKWKWCVTLDEANACCSGCLEFFVEQDHEVVSDRGAITDPYYLLWSVLACVTNTCHP